MGDLVILITYAGAMTTGNQYALECRTAYCGAGCQPKLENPLDFKQNAECKVVDDYASAHAVNVECSGRVCVTMAPVSASATRDTLTSTAQRRQHSSKKKHMTNLLQHYVHFFWYYWEIRAIIAPKFDSP